jgi:hypothetical protein
MTRRNADARPKLVAPADGQALVEPTPDRIGDVLDANRALLAGEDFDCQGRSRRQLASHARAELLRLARAHTARYRDVPTALAADAPLLLAGHQPELFHAGVWFKNYLLDSLARRHGAVAVNLVVDNDRCKSASLSLPTGSLDSPRRETAPLDAPAEPIPWEDRAIVDEPTFYAAADAVKQAIGSLVPNPLIGDMWRLVIERAAATSRLGAALAEGRHAYEGQLGLATLELPISRVAELEAFAWFAAHFFARLPRVWDIYNSALADHRRAERIRSATHPVPDLAAQGDWLEAPLWVWTADDPHRRALFVRQSGDEVILSDRASWHTALALSADGEANRAAAQLQDLARHGVRIRPRALLTTMFARLFLGDLFIHGIGGAKYDQLTDLLIALLFGLTPPKFVVATATFRLPIAGKPACHSPEKSVGETLRDVQYHPEKHLGDGAVRESSSVPSLKSLLELKQQWIERSKRAQGGQPLTPEQRRLRHGDITQANAALAAAAKARLGHLDAARGASRVEDVLCSREYSFSLFPHDWLVPRLSSAAEHTNAKQKGTGSERPR